MKGCCKITAPQQKNKEILSQKKMGSSSSILLPSTSPSAFPSDPSPDCLPMDSPLHPFDFEWEDAVSEDFEVPEPPSQPLDSASTQRIKALTLLQDAKWTVERVA